MTAGYVQLEQVAAMTARALVRELRAGGPTDALELELNRRRAGDWGTSNRRRASLYFLAEFYAWSARRPEIPMGGDPRDGRPWPRFDRLGMAIARAEHIAAARVVYEAARAVRSPFELLTQAEGWARQS